MWMTESVNVSERNGWRIGCEPRCSTLRNTISKLMEVHCFPLLPVVRRVYCLWSENRESKGHVDAESVCIH